MAFEIINLLTYLLHNMTAHKEQTQNTRQHKNYTHKLSYQQTQNSLCSSYEVTQSSH